MKATSPARFRHGLVSLLLAAAIGASGCAAQDTPDDRLPDNDDQADNAIPTDGLKMLSTIGDQATLEGIFHASSVDRESTLSEINAELDARGATTVSIKGEGVPVFLDLFGGVDVRLGSGLSAIARNIWSGKIFTFVRQPDGVLTASLENAIVSTQLFRAEVTINSLAGAMAARNEPDPGAAIEQFGFNMPEVEVDEQNSVIIDYEADTDVLGIFSSLIDEIRPVSPEALAAVGLKVPEGVNIDDLWLGRATALFGLFNAQREFVVYFAIDFDRSSMKFE